MNRLIKNLFDRNDRLFKFYKILTMTDERDTNGELFPNSDRLTGLG